MRERAVVLTLGVYQVGVGLLMLLAPSVFFELLGPFGVRNDHYTVDAGTLELAAGVLFLGALRWPGWLVPALCFGVVQWSLHAANHLLDIGEADPRWIGVVDFAALAGGAGVLAWLLLRASRSEALR